MVGREEQYLSSYTYISWRLNCAKSWEMKKITVTEQKIYKGKELMLYCSFSVLDTDLFIFSVPSSPFHTQISSPDAMAAAEAAEDVALPANLWVKTPHTPREAVT